MGVFLPHAALKGLKKYKYASEDHSPVSKYILKPFYQRFSLIFPKWFAPNLVTLTGFFFVWVNFITMLYYNPSFSEECPRWVYFSYGVGLFLYQTFDACDGIQARRTGQSGPLGELFDHCVDALNTTLEVLLFASAVNLGYGWIVVASQFATLFNFYLSTWEEYHTGVLYLSFFSGPVEGILMIIIMYFTTALFGPSIWHQPIIPVIGLESFTADLNIPDYAKNYLIEASIIDYYIVFASLALGFNIFAAAGNVIKSLRAKPKRATRTSTPATPLLVISRVVPFLAFYASLIFWISLSPDLLYHHLLPLAFATGVTFAYTVGQIILAHLTKQDFPIWNYLLLLPSFGILVHYSGEYLAWDPKLTSLCTVWAGLGLSLGVYGSFIGEIITDITSYLDIGCLYIKYPVDKDK